MEYILTIASKYTFDSKKVKDFVIKNCKGKILNLFAGKNLLGLNEFRIDLDETMPKLDYIGNGLDYLKYSPFENHMYDTVIFDPPWNDRKAREKYNGRTMGKFQWWKPHIIKRLNPGGLIISAGYDIRYFTKEDKYNRFKRIITLVVDQPGDIKPFFVTVEKYMKSENLGSWL